MRLVVDTNVLISGAFYPGPSSRILDACMRGKFQLVLSPDIIDEYTRVGEEFTRKRPNVLFARYLEVLKHGAARTSASPAKACLRRP